MLRAGEDVAGATMPEVWSAPPGTSPAPQAAAESVPPLLRSADSSESLALRPGRPVGLHVAKVFDEGRKALPGQALQGWCIAALGSRPGHVARNVNDRL